MISQLRADGRPLFVVDAGNMFWKAPMLPASLDAETRVKARLQAESVALAGIDAMLPAEGDWALGRAFVEETAAAFDLPYLAANLECEQKLPFPRYRVVERDGLRVAFVGVLPASMNVPGCRVGDPASLFTAAQAENPDLVVLLSGQRRVEDEKLLARQEVDLVLNGRDRELSSAGEPIGQGALWIGGGSRGKQVIVAELERVAGASGWSDAGALEDLAAGKDRYARRLAELEKRRAAATDPKEQARLDTQIGFFRKQLAEASAKVDAAAATQQGKTNRASVRMVELGTDVADEPRTAALVAKAKEQISGAPAAVPVARPEGIGPFLGSSGCLACHAPEAAQWAGTGHSRAWASLIAKNRQGERECAECHSTGAFHPDGPKAVAEMMPDVGCEACHGPGRDHALQPTAVKLVADTPQQTCVVCHDAKNDGGRFVWEEYRSRVVHATP